MLYKTMGISYRILPAAFLCLVCVSAGYTQTFSYDSIDPSAFDTISNNSINLIDTYVNFSNLIYDNKNRTLFHANTIMMPDYYVVQTSVGPVVVTPLLADVLLYFKGFVFIATTVDLRIGWLQNSHLSNEYRFQYGWPNRSCIAGYRLGILKGNDVTLGVVWRNMPYITEDSGGNKIFGFYNDPVWGIRTSTTTFIVPFFHMRLLGIDVATTYNAENPEFDSTGLRIGIGLGKVLGKLELGGSYSKYSNEMISGFSLSKFSPADWLSLNIKYYEDNSTEETAYFVPSASFFFKKGNKPENDTENPDKLDTFSSLDVGYSYSNDLFSEPVYGCSVGYSLENYYLGRKWYGNISAGLSYNYHDTLYRIPLRDELLFSVKIQTAR